MVDTVRLKKISIYNFIKIEVKNCEEDYEQRV